MKIYVNPRRILWEISFFSQLFTRWSQADNYHASSLLCFKRMRSHELNRAKSNFEGIFEEVFLLSFVAMGKEQMSAICECKRSFVYFLH